MPAAAAINSYDFLILILAASKDSNTIRGRTTLQKIGYFASNDLKLENDYIPHYYGPFSPSLALVLKRLIAVKLVNEEQAVTNNDRKLYTYSLTKKGKDYSEELKASYNRQFTKIKKIVNKIKSLRGNKIENLSYAAKVHYLTKGKSKTPVSAIQHRAQSLGWDMSENSIHNSIHWLAQQS